MLLTDSIPHESLPGDSPLGSFLLCLRKKADGSLTLAPRSIPRQLFWSALLVVALCILLPLFDLIGILLGINPFGNTGVLSLGLGAIMAGVAFIGGVTLLFLASIDRAAPRIHFDPARNVISREKINFGWFYPGVHVDKFQTPLRRARAVQLCYGGFEPDSDGHGGSHWWQLLIVGESLPPARAVLVADHNRARLTRWGRQIAEYLSVPWIDNGDLAPENQGQA